MSAVTVLEHLDYVREAFVKARDAADEYVSSYCHGEAEVTEFLAEFEVLENRLAQHDAIRADVVELIEAMQAFVVHNSSEETLAVTLRSGDVTRARAALARAKGEV